MADSTRLAGFARFLYDQKLYDFAAEEYERLHYLFPNEAGYLTQLLKSYRKLNKYDEVEKKGASLDLKTLISLRNMFCQWPSMTSRR